MDNNYDKKTWLKRLQYDSWEPEILISGIVIYGLFKIFPSVEDLGIYLNNYGGKFMTQGNVDDNIIILVEISLSWLIAGFIIHLLLRSIWVAYIGLSYLHNGNIDVKKLKYKERFTKQISKRFQYESLIEKLEKACSSVFSLSFLFFMNVLGFIFLFTLLGIFLFIALKLFPEQTDYSILSVILVTLFLINIIDYLTLGLLKRLPYVNKIYYPIYKFISFITLAPLYKNIYYSFILIYKKRTVIFFLVGFILITAFSYVNKSTTLYSGTLLKPFENKENVLKPENYLDQYGGKISEKLWIPSQTINSNYLEAFVVHTSKWEQDKIKPLCQYDKQVKANPKQKDSIKITCLKKFYQLKIDGVNVKADAFYSTNKITNQDGLKHFIDISHLSKGVHEIQLFYNFYIKDQDTIKAKRFDRFKFFKTIDSVDR